MCDPVLCGDGWTYDRAALERWVARDGYISPVTREPFVPESVTPNRSVRRLSPSSRV